MTCSGKTVTADREIKCPLRRGFRDKVSLNTNVNPVNRDVSPVKTEEKVSDVDRLPAVVIQ